MATLSYSRPKSGGYGASAGLRFLAAVESEGADPFTTAQAASIGAGLGLGAGHTLKLLHQLADSGWLTRIKRGLYAINDPVTRLPKAHPFAIGVAVVKPSAVSHWSALQHWGLTEQIPGTVMVSSPARTFPPAGAHAAHDRPSRTVAGVAYEFVTIAPPRYFGVTLVWVNERNQVPIFDRERALLDAFSHFQVFGSLSAGLEMLDAHWGDLDRSRLVEYAVRLRVAAVVKRLGWALETLGAPSDELAPLRAYPARGDTPLDPGRPARGRHNSTWHVIENLRDGR
jgi:predicted transcriptional regulator of viral defense system